MKKLQEYIGARDKTARGQPFLQSITIKYRKFKPFILNFGFYILEFTDEDQARKFLDSSCDLSDCEGGKEYLRQRNSKGLRDNEKTLILITNMNAASAEITTDKRIKE